MRQGKAVIGVIGPTNGIENIDPKGAITQLAQDVERIIVEAQHLLLTGGLPASGVPSPINRAAMHGAMGVGNSKQPARLISVLPGKNNFNIPQPTITRTYKHMLVETPFTCERNYINGTLADILIAIHGGKGTLSEIAFAFSINTPVILLNVNGVVETLGSLKGLVNANRNSSLNFLNATSMVYSGFNPAVLSNAVEDFIKQDQHIVAYSCVDAVMKAIDIARGLNKEYILATPIHALYTNEFKNFLPVLDMIVT